MSAFAAFDNSQAISFLDREKERLLDFLNHNNSLSEKAPAIDYRLKQHQILGKGTFGALMESQKNAIIKHRIDFQDLLTWHAMIAAEWNANGKVIPLLDRDSGEILQARYALARFLDRLGQMDRFPDPSQIVEAMAEWLYHIEGIAPFGELNGVICRLMINYAATWCHFPIFIFHQVEKEIYESSVKDLSTARFYVGQKIREAVFDH